MKKNNSIIIDNDILKFSLQEKIYESKNIKTKFWLKLIEKLPEDLKHVLLIELELGNKVFDIQDCDWPQSGSIVVNLSLPFKNKDIDKIQGVEFRKMNDPHYWLEDVHVLVNGIEHLIIH